jgi:hypothetical protein
MRMQLLISKFSLDSYNKMKNTENHMGGLSYKLGLDDEGYPTGFICTQR